MGVDTVGVDIHIRLSSGLRCCDERKAFPKGAE
jgi:hypothetical protein